MVGKGRPMEARLGYAFKRTLSMLESALSAENDYIIIPAFIIVLFSFGTMQIVLEHATTSLSTSAASALATATLFFLSTVGFITFIWTIFIFSYSFAVGNKFAQKLSRGRSRAWLLVLSFILTGAVTAAVFDLFCDGLREVSLLRMQYDLFLSNGD
jgi:hypothetical protein